MPRIRPVALPLAILSILLLSTLSFAAAPNRITRPIVVSQSVRVGGGAPLQTRRGSDEGLTDPTLKLPYMTLLTVPTSAQKSVLDKLLAEQQNPRSGEYHKWITGRQYADRFGLSQNDIDKLTGWLQSQGFSIVRVANARNWIAFSGTVGQVESSFQTEIHNFKVNGEAHFANVRPIAIPGALSGIVTGVRGINDFRPQSQARRSNPEFFFSGGGNNYQFISPGDILKIYDVTALQQAGITGAGQKLVVVGETGVYQSDLTNFRQNFGLSAISCTVTSDIIQSCNTSNFQYVLVNGTPNLIYGDLPEADIDLEWSGATAPGAKVIYVTANSNTGTTWDSWYYAVDNQSQGANLGESVITMSYTSPCEAAEDTIGTGEGTYVSDEAELAQANSLGITFMNSSGDTGVAECDYQASIADLGYNPAYPASSQYVTGVGGTLIPYNEYGTTYWNNSNPNPEDGSAKGYIPEQPWNDSLEFAIFCEANPTQASFCQHYGVGAGPLLADWDNVQENVIGISAGGGGVSNCSQQDAHGVCTGGFPRPSWQSGIDPNVVSPNGFGITTSPARMSPDVSLLASANWPGYLVCTQYGAIGGSGSGSSCNSPTTGISAMLTACLVGNPPPQPCSIFGGTSVSSPIFAGMVALLNQYVVTNGIQATPGLGNFNPTLYSLAASNATNGAFNPITTASGSGVYSNGAFCTPGDPVSGVSGDPWPATLVCPSSGTPLLTFNSSDADPTTGYNLAVGLGSVNLSHLAAALGTTKASTTTSVVSDGSPSNYGDSVTFTATVITTGADTPTGNVTFKNGSSTLATVALGGCVCDGVVKSATASYTTTPTQLPAGSDSITAVYAGDANNAGSTSPAWIQVVNPATFTFTSTGSASHTVLAGQTSLTYTFTATPTSGATFVSAVNIECSFSGSDPTLTSNVCSYSVNGGATQTGAAVIPAGSAASVVTVSIQSAGPNTGTGTFRRQSENRLPWVPMTLPLAGVVLAGFAGRKRSKYALACSLCLALAMAGFLIACGGGGGGNSTPPISVSVGSSASSIYPQNTGWTNSTATFTATVSNDSSGKGVTWTVSPTLGGQSITATDTTHATYTPPTIATGLPGSVNITATSVADSTKSGGHPITLTPTTVPNNNPGYTVTVSATETGATTPTAPTVLLVVN